MRWREFGQELFKRTCHSYILARRQSCYDHCGTGTNAVSWSGMREKRTRKGPAPYNPALGRASDKTSIPITSAIRELGVLEMCDPMCRLEVEGAQVAQQHRTSTPGRRLPTDASATWSRPKRSMPRHDSPTIHLHSHCSKKRPAQGTGDIHRSKRRTRVAGRNTEKHKPLAAVPFVYAPRVQEERWRVSTPTE